MKPQMKTETNIMSGSPRVQPKTSVFAMPYYNLPQKSSKNLVSNFCDSFLTSSFTMVRSGHSKRPSETKDVKPKENMERKPFVNRTNNQPRKSRESKPPVSASMWHSPENSKMKIESIYKCIKPVNRATSYKAIETNPSAIHSAIKQTKPRSEKRTVVTPKQPKTAADLQNEKYQKIIMEQAMTIIDLKKQLKMQGSPKLTRSQQEEAPTVPNFSILVKPEDRPPQDGEDPLKSQNDQIDLVLSFLQKKMRQYPTQSCEQS